MGNSKYLDALSPAQRLELNKKLWSIQNHTCFICGEAIDLDIQTTNVDHIKPLTNGGKDDPVNFAITHELCNKSKQDSDLEIAKRLHRLQKIIEDASHRRETPSLKHVLLAHDGSQFDFSYKIEGDTLVYSFDELGSPAIKRTEIFTDPLSKERTAFLTVPLAYLFHDEIINPRGINGTISLLIKEFYKPNPQLHLSLARIDHSGGGGKIRIFDGQHKAVAQIMLGVKEILVRLFIDPDLDRLIETNTIAGSKLKQIAFDKAIVRQLHDTLYAERLRKYQKDHLLAEDDFSFSEQALVEHFKGERGNVKLYIINSQKNAVTHAPENRLQSYINFDGRGTTWPLSYSTFEKTFLSTFINPKTILATPINYKADEGLNPRILERDQAVRLCNILAEELLIGRYDEQTGTRRLENTIAAGNGDNIPDSHLTAYRLFKEEIMYNWVKYLRRVIVNYFANTGVLNDEDNLLQQKLPDQVWENLRNFTVNLRDLPVWRDRSMSATIFGGKNNSNFWDVIFRTAAAPDGTPVLAAPLNLMEMIKKP